MKKNNLEDIYLNIMNLDIEEVFKMIKLIQNEMSKVKSEKFIVIIILLSLIPFIMNLANFS